MDLTIPGDPVMVLLFALFALLSVVGAIRVVTASDPFISALSLLFNFVSLGALYLMLDQPFVAIAQILVYAGAVVVLFLFVIAYLGDRRELAEDAVRARLFRPLGLLVGVGFAGLLAGVALVADLPATVEQLPDTDAGHAFGSAHAVGEVFLTRFTLEFEVTSLVLLVAAIGGIILGLTGRARHDRMRKLMNTRSSDQQRRWYDAQEQQDRADRRARMAGTAPTAAGATDKEPAS